MFYVNNLIGWTWASNKVKFNFIKVVSIFVAEPTAGRLTTSWVKQCRNNMFITFDLEHKCNRVSLWCTSFQQLVHQLVLLQLHIEGILLDTFIKHSIFLCIHRLSMIRNTNIVFFNLMSVLCGSNCNSTGPRHFSGWEYWISPQLGPLVYSSVRF